MTIIAPHRADQCVPLSTYSAALDEIYFLRSALAYEARVVDTALGYKTMAQTVRAKLGAVRERLAQAARGERDQHIQGTASAKFCLRWVGASDTLTRHEWETQRGIKGADA
jgi:hypothetical protein